MNKKAEKFAKMLKDNKITFFNHEEVKDELNTVVFRSAMEIDGQRLPLVIIIDDSIYVVSRTLIVGKAVTQENRSQVIDCLNKLNASYKTFKFYVTGAGEILLDACIPATDEQFEPDMVRAMVDLAIKNLEENYKLIMKAVWGTSGEKEQEAAS